MGSILGYAKGKQPYINRFHDLNAEINNQNLKQWYKYPRWRRVMYLIGSQLVRRSGVHMTWTY